MKILVACEESQSVTAALRNRGHEAYSCDIEPCSGGHPEWHIMGDVLPLLNGRCSFKTMDGCNHETKEKWDMLFAFPPCTYLTSAGTRHYSTRCNSVAKVNARIARRESAALFFMRFVNADCEKIVIENPVGYMSTYYRKPDQIIHPYYFAESEQDKENYYQKRTCLWLKGVSILVRKTNLQKPSPQYYCKGEKCYGKAIGWCEGMRGIQGGQKERAKARSKTFVGVAEAMAEQWA